MSLKIHAEIVQVTKVIEEQFAINFLKLQRFGQDEMIRNSVHIMPKDSNFPISGLVEGKKYAMISVKIENNWFIIQTTDESGVNLTDSDLLAYCFKSLD